MSQRRIFDCDFPDCLKSETEEAFGTGVTGWSGLVGLSINGNDQPAFCPSCTEKIMGFIDPIKKEVG